MKYLLTTTILAFIFSMNVQAQGTEVNPEVGKRVPTFKLENIGNYKKPKMSSADFRGRHVILDFWNKNCVTCVQSFSKLDQLHKQFSDKLDLILVGAEDAGIEEMFARFREKQRLQFPYAFNMSMYKAFVPGGAPHIVWIDDLGIVQAISGGKDLNAANVEAFLSNKPFDFSDHSHSFFARQEAAYNPRKPFLLEGNGGKEYEANVQFRSLITPYIPGPWRSWPDVNLWSQKFSTGRPDGNRRVFEVTTGLKELYTMAYTGWVNWSYGDKPYTEIYPHIILEMADTSLFEADVKNGHGLYWYSLIAPASRVSPEYVMKSMQQDLERYFGYTAHMETRKVPVLKIMATEKAKKLKTKGKQTEPKVDHSMFRATDISLEDFFRSELTYMNYWKMGGTVPVIINETGMTDNVDIDIQINDGNWQDIQRALNELGFELVPAEKEFLVLVIGDAKNP